MEDSIIFPNEQAADGAITGKLNQYLANNPSVDKTVVTKLVQKIYSNTTSEVLIWLNSPKVRELNWSPNAIVQTDPNDPKWADNGEV